MSSLFFPFGVDITKILIRMSHENDPMIVIDIGTGVCKAGLASKDEMEPKVVMPTVLGTTKDGVFIGEEALKKCASDSLCYPMEHGVIMKWDEMEQILKYIFEALKVNPRDRSILLTQVPGIPDGIIDKLSQVVFEKYNLNSLFIAKPAVLSLYSTGRLDGVVTEIGEGVTNIVPIKEGYAITENMVKLDFAGKELTEFMLTSLRDSGVGNLDYRVAQDMKERLCYVSNNFDLENSTAVPDITFQLGNGNSVSIGKERFIVPEAFFKPELTRKISLSLQQNIVNCIMKCDEGLREKLFKNIVLTGGSAQFPGFSDRLKREIIALADPAHEVNVIVPPCQKYSAWIGGAILGTLSDLRKMLVKKNDYETSGANIVKEKCGFQQ